MMVLDNALVNSFTLILLALCMELLVGWPKAVFTRIRHPVVWMGTLISFFERRLNRSTFTAGLRKLYGILTTFLVVLLCSSLALALTTIIADNLTGLILEALLASSLLAARSLYTHVAAVSTPLAEADLANARTELAKIVGRDTTQLDEQGVAGAALESLAENASDGVIAPVFWGVTLGLPGLVAYKAINTLDSMIGHKNERYLAFGAFAARLDDVANWIPARLTALLIWVCGRIKPALRDVAAQAGHHRSPNAGWPESAMAFALGVKLSGPRQYETVWSHEPWLNSAGKAPGEKELQRGLRLYSCTIGLSAVVLLVLAIVSG